MSALRIPASSSTHAHELHRGETISMDHRRGYTLRCLSGQVWITQTGDAIDHLVPAGRDFKVTRPGRVVIQALTENAALADIGIAA